MGHVQGEKVPAQIFGVPPEWTPNWDYWNVPSSGWRKQSFWEGKRQKFELKLFLLGHDLYKRYILQKTGSKTAICVLRTGLSNLNPLMWGSHGQLDDWPTKTQMTIGDHLVGWATRRSQPCSQIASKWVVWWSMSPPRPGWSQYRDRFSSPLSEYANLWLLFKGCAL